MATILLFLSFVDAQDIKLWTDYSNVCGGAIVTPKKDGEYVSYLGDFNSYGDCQQECISKSTTSNQCESFTYFSSKSNDTANKLGCYARFNDPLWLPCIDNGIVSGEVYWSCRDDIDCSLNGKCSNGSCSCRPAWKGARCQLLNILPAPTNGGFKGYATSSWGGTVLRNDNDDSFHMFLSYFPNYCGHTADTMNSHVAHAISTDSHVGPYKVIGQLAQEWSHEPFATRGPNGEYVVYFSYTRNTPFWPILCNCSANMNGTTTTECCKDTPNACNYKKPANLTRHTTVMRWTNDLNDDNSWSDINYLWPANETGPTNQDTNFVAIIFPNGTVFGFNRMWTKEKGSVLYYVRASNWSDPSTYVEEFNNTLFPQWVYPGNEDQFIYQDGNGYFHFLFHNMIPGYNGGHDEYFSGAHACSKDGYNWTFFGYAYDNNVTYDDGTYHTFQSTERPHLIFAKDGITPIALTNGAIYDGNSANHDRSFTILRPINTD